MINYISKLIEECRDDEPLLTQDEIAKAAKVNAGVLSRYINGHVSGFKFEVEYRLCRYFSKKLGRPITRLIAFDPDDLMTDNQQ